VLISFVHSKIVFFSCTTIKNKPKSLLSGISGLDRTCRCRCHRRVDAEQELRGSIIDSVDLWHPGRRRKKDYHKTNNIHHRTGFYLNISRI
jgi:hypothetical protein